MIAKGFVRDIHGTWTNLNCVNKFYVQECAIEKWGIFASIIFINDCLITCSETEELAQKYLDDMMRDIL